MEAHVKTPALLVSWLQRLTQPPLPSTAAKPAKNSFHSVAIPIERPAQLALIYLQRLVEKDLQAYNDSLPMPEPTVAGNCNPAELLTLSVLLPRRDYQESGLPSELLVVTHKQYVLLCRYLDQQMRFLNTHRTSKLWDVHPMTLDMVFKALTGAMHRRTKLLFWTELCQLPTR